MTISNKRECINNAVSQALEAWRLNNHINGSNKTKLLIECYKQYKHTSKIGVTSKFMIFLLPHEAKKAQGYLKPSFREIPRTSNPYSLNDNGQRLILDLDHMMEFSGLTWSKTLETNINKYAENLK